MAAGISGKPCRNPELRAFQSRSNKMVSTFSRSGVATASFYDAQDKDSSLKGKRYSLAAPNATRWLGLYKQARRNRELQPHIAEALCGNSHGIDVDDEEVYTESSRQGAPGASDSSDDEVFNNDESEETSKSSSDEDMQTDAGDDSMNTKRRFRSRLLTNDDFRDNSQWESCLAPLADVSALLQGHDNIRLEQGFLFLMTLLNQFESNRLQLVSGRANMETWDDVSVLRLKGMFRTFRKEVAEQLNSRFKLKGTPNEHVLLCLKLNPFIDTSSDGSFGGRATQELMEATYKQHLRHACKHMKSAKERACKSAASPAANDAPTPRAAEPAGAGATGASPANPVAATPVTPAAASSTESPHLSVEPKKRQRISSLATAMHIISKTPSNDANTLDASLQREVDDFAHAVATVDLQRYQVVNSGNEVLDYDVDLFW